MIPRFPIIFALEEHGQEFVHLLICGAVFVARPAEADMQVHKLVGFLPDLESKLIEDALIGDVIAGGQLASADLTRESLRVEGLHGTKHHA